MSFWFPDTTVLRNFAAVDRMNLLEGLLRGRGRWAEAIAAEIADVTGSFPCLRPLLDAGGWLGEPIEITDPEQIKRVERCRRQVFGGAAGEPRKHLGEAQTIDLITELSAYRESWWITDDNDAGEYARARGITTRNTVDLVRHIVVDGDLTGEDAIALLQQMWDRGRPVTIPASVKDLLRD